MVKQSSSKRNVRSTTRTVRRTVVRPRRSRRSRGMRSLTGPTTRVSLPTNAGVLTSGNQSVVHRSAPAHDRYGVGLRLEATQIMCMVGANSTAAVNRIFQLNHESTSSLCAQMCSSITTCNPGSTPVTHGRFHMWSDSDYVGNMRNLYWLIRLYRKMAVRLLEVEYVPTSTTLSNYNLAFAAVESDFERNAEESTFSSICSLPRSFTTPAWSPAKCRLIDMVKPNQASSVLFDTVPPASDLTSFPNQVLILGATSELPTSSANLGFLRMRVVVDLYELSGSMQSVLGVPSENFAKPESKEAKVVAKDDHFVMVQSSSSTSSLSTSSQSSSPSTSLFSSMKFR